MHRKSKPRSDERASSSANPRLRPRKPVSTAVLSAALQDQFARDLKLMNISTKITSNSRHRSDRKSTRRRNSLTLAQRIGITEGPPVPLSAEEWEKVQTQSQNRNDSCTPCPICHEDFAVEPQVLLSCSHVFHKVCLRSFERFSNTRTCPICRRKDYEKRTITDGYQIYQNKSAKKIQSIWRGILVRKRYRHLLTSSTQREKRREFYGDKLSKVTDSMVREVTRAGESIDDLFAEIDANIQLSRTTFSESGTGTSVDWESVQQKAISLDQDDCPICMAPLQFKSAECSFIAGEKTPLRKRHALLSCSHLFHQHCIQSFEKFSSQHNPICPLCRSQYSKKIL